MTDQEDHRFGGEHTAIKLDILEQYLRAYCQALKNLPLKRVYIDAFAGAGFYTPKTENAGPQPGSTRKALETGGFDEYIFIENNSDRFAELQRVRKDYPKFKISLYNNDANIVLPEILEAPGRRRWRGVLFIDPYGLEVHWTTLVKIAETQIIDVWYLFSLSGLYRQVPHEIAKLDRHKQDVLDRCLGTKEWRNEFYKKSRQKDLFDNNRMDRSNVDSLEQFVQNRLASIFVRVLNPVRLPRHGAPLFSLFFAISNRSPKAIRLATKIANHILNHT